MNTSKSLTEILLDFLKEDDDGNVNLAKAREAIVEAVEGLIIGQDEPVEGTPPYMTQDGKRSEKEQLITAAQNALRRSQRKAIKEWQDGR